MTWLYWLQTLCLFVALGFAYAENRALRARLAALEDVSRRLVAVYGDIADAINWTSETTATALNGNASAIHDFLKTFKEAMWGKDSTKETNHD